MVLKWNYKNIIIMSNSNKDDFPIFKKDCKNENTINKNDRNELRYINTA